MRVDEIITDEEDLVDWKASKALCTSSKPDSALGASALSSCKAQGYRRRRTGKSQLKGRKRKSLDGVKAKSKQYGGWVSPTKTG